MKKLALIALSLLLVVSATAVAFAEGELKVAGIVFQDDQFMNMLTKGYVDAAADLGVECLTDNTNNDQAKEVELITTYVAQGINGIAIAPLSKDASIAQLQLADEQGVKVAITNLDLTDCDFPVATFASNDYLNCSLVGKVAGEAIVEKFGDKTVKVALIQFKSLLPDQSTSRVNGYLDAIAAAGVECEVVADQDGWLQDMAIEKVDGILTANPDLDVIIAVNDGGTIGSTMAVINAGKAADILVFGHDGGDQISALVLDEASPLFAAVAQDPYGQGYSAMTALIKALKGEDVSDTQGQLIYKDGIVLSKADPEGVLKYRADEGL